jgi:hypothetical protein
MRLSRASKTVSTQWQLTAGQMSINQMAADDGYWHFSDVANLTDDVGSWG